MNPSSPTDTVALMAAIIYATSAHSIDGSIEAAQQIYSKVQPKEKSNECDSNPK